MSQQPPSRLFKKSELAGKEGEVLVVNTTGDGFDTRPETPSNKVQRLVITPTVGVNNFTSGVLIGREIVAVIRDGVNITTILLGSPTPTPGTTDQVGFNAINGQLKFLEDFDGESVLVLHENP